MDHQADAIFRQKAVIEFLTKEGIAAKNISDRQPSTSFDINKH
jgi:hypothetical protein